MINQLRLLLGHTLLVFIHRNVNAVILVFVKILNDLVVAILGDGGHVGLSFERADAHQCGDIGEPMGLRAVGDRFKDALLSNGLINKVAWTHS